jgi:hypothetical protein
MGALLQQHATAYKKFFASFFQKRSACFPGLELSALGAEFHEY